MDDPDDVTNATEEYRSESDALGRFLRECCMDHGQVRSSDLFDAWSRYCAAEREEAGTQKHFSTELTNRGYDKKPTNTGVFWLSLSLAAPSTEGDGS